MNMDTKSFIKILANHIPQKIKGSYIMIKVDLAQSINLVYHKKTINVICHIIDKERPPPKIHDLLNQYRQ